MGRRGWGTICRWSVLHSLGGEDAEFWQKLKLNKQSIVLVIIILIAIQGKRGWFDSTFKYNTSDSKYSYTQRKGELQFYYFAPGLHTLYTKLRCILCLVFAIFFSSSWASKNGMLIFDGYTEISIIWISSNCNCKNELFINLLAEHCILNHR